VGGKIRHHYVNATAPVQFPDQGAPDKTGPAGNEYPASLPDIGLLIFRYQFLPSTKQFAFSSLATGYLLQRQNPRISKDRDAIHFLLRLKYS
jgi:hypothetical protein